jgi:hypothetical protein
VLNLFRKPVIHFHELPPGVSRAGAIFPTDCQREGGLTLVNLHEACPVMAEGDVVGLEIAEFEDTWEPEGEAVPPAPLSPRAPSPRR